MDLIYDVNDMDWACFSCKFTSSPTSHHSV